jgi:hypothetical protein
MIQQEAVPLNMQHHSNIPYHNCEFTQFRLFENVQYLLPNSTIMIIGTKTDLSSKREVQISEVCIIIHLHC